MNFRREQAKREVGRALDMVCIRDYSGIATFASNTGQTVKVHIQTRQPENGRFWVC